MIKNKGIFIINSHQEDEEFLDNFDWNELEEGYNKAKKFFEYPGEINPIRICFVYSPEEYLFFSGYPKHENWMKACTGYHNTIYIFAPSVVEEYTIHKKEDTLKTLIHELAHFFYGYSSMKKNLTILPLWDEGIANYIADKKMNLPENLQFSSLRNFTDNASTNYVLGYNLIKNIMDYFKEEGNKKVIEFLNKAKQDDSEELLFKKFEEVFGVNVSIIMKGGKEK